MILRTKTLETPPDKNDKLGDPLFVDPENNDFHLKTGSPAIGAGSDGSTHDIGAYGGIGADLRLFPVSGLAISGETGDGFTVSWKANQDYNVKGYKVLYNPNSKPASGGIAVCPGNVVSHSITGITGVAVTKPPPPSNFTAGINDSSLNVSWSIVEQNTTAEYEIQYGTSSGNYNDPDSPKIAKGRKTQKDLISNLTNGQKYFLVISTIAKPVVFVAVTALDIPPPSSCTTTQDGSESNIVEAEQAEAFLTGSDIPSDPSSEISATPEPAVRFPSLEDEGGCFIASLAFGSPLEPYLKTLRNFRDQFLLKNTGGRKLTKLYYRFSPSANQWLEQNEVLKPFLRILLYPTVWIISIWMSGPIIWNFSLMGVFLIYLMKFLIKQKVFSKLGESY